MQVYLTGTPQSTKKHRLGHDVGPQTRETVHQALVERARQYHEFHPEGLDPAAHKLSLARTVSQLRTARGGKHVILCWVWLSDGSRHRAAWVSEDLAGTLYRTWARVEWGRIVFSAGDPSSVNKMHKTSKVARG